MHTSWRYNNDSAITTKKKKDSTDILDCVKKHTSLCQAVKRV